MVGDKEKHADESDTVKTRQIVLVVHFCGENGLAVLPD